MASIDASPMADLVTIIRQQGAVYNPPALMFADVIVPPPHIQIKINDVILDENFVYVAEHLKSGYQKGFNSAGNLKATGTGSGTITGNAAGNISTTGSATTSATAVSTYGTHTHTVSVTGTGTANLNVTGTVTTTDTINSSFTESGTITYSDELKAGDMVAVLATSDKQKYLVFCKI